MLRLFNLPQIYILPFMLYLLQFWLMFVWLVGFCLFFLCTIWWYKVFCLEKYAGPEIFQPWAFGCAHGLLSLPPAVGVPTLLHPSAVHVNRGLARESQPRGMFPAPGQGSAAVRLETKPYGKLDSGREIPPAPLSLPIGVCGVRTAACNSLK